MEPRTPPYDLRGHGSESKVYAVPRRFDLATIFVVTVAYAILFGLMRALGCPLGEFALFVVFVTSVGLGQALLFHGRSPRLASVVVGSALGFVGVFGALAMTALRDQSGVLGAVLYSISEFHILVAAPAVTFGGISGYITGTLVGSVFLTSDACRNMAKRHKERSR